MSDGGVRKTDGQPVWAAAVAGMLPPSGVLPVIGPADDPVSAAAAAGMAGWAEASEAVEARLMSGLAKLGGSAATTNAVIDSADEANSAGIGAVGDEQG